MRKIFRHILIGDVALFIFAFLLGAMLISATFDKTIPERKAPKFDSIFAFKVAEQAATDALRNIGFKKANVIITVYRESKEYTIFVNHHQILDEQTFYFAVGTMIGITDGIVTSLNNHGFAGWTAKHVFGTFTLIHEKTQNEIVVRTSMLVRDVLILADMPVETEEQKDAYWDYLWSHFEVMAVQ